MEEIDRGVTGAEVGTETEEIETKTEVTETQMTESTRDGRDRCRRVDTKTWVTDR